MPQKIDAMSAGMKYRYRDIGKYLVCVDQTVTGALRRFILGYDSNMLDSLGISKLLARNIVKVLAKNRLRPQSADYYEVLPVFGHLGMYVHRGFKLFDFEASTVTKIFASGISKSEAEQEIAASREACAVRQAPRFIAADPGSDWFTEEYVRGIHATDLVAPKSGDYLRYYADAENCLLELLECKAPTVVDAMSHITDLADNAYRDRWLDAGFARQEIDGISHYLESVRSWLADNLPAGHLQLVRTHGDFSLVNAISTESGLRIIDWEGIGPGSLYSDIYNFAFAEYYYGRTGPDFVSELGSVIERFRAAVLERKPKLRNAAMMNQTVVRRLYYLERVRLMANRDVTTNLYSVIEKSIAMFNEFDRDIGDVPL